MGKLWGVVGSSSPAPVETTSASHLDSTTFEDGYATIRSTFHPTMTAEQPVTAASDDVLIWLIGDLYGFEGGSGYTPREPDEDVDQYCAKLYDRYGTGFASGANGSFAAVLYDRNDHTVSIVTDRLGTVPVYYARPDPETVVFGTRIQEVADTPIVDTEYVEEYLHEYLAYRRTFGVKTPLAGIEEVQPGAVTTFGSDRATPEVDEYWRPRYRPQNVPFEAFVDRFVELIQRVLGEWMREGFTYGLLLSGGSDSRLILSALEEPVTAFHMAGWMSREARTAERAALMNGSEFELLKRDEQYQVEALERNPPLSNFNGWFSQGYPSGFDREIVDSVDGLLSGMYADTLFKRHGVPTPTLSVEPVGNHWVPIEKEIDSIDGYVDWLTERTHDGLDFPTDIRRVLRENIVRDGEEIVHHGVRYDSVRDLVYCSGYYPMTNDDDMLFTDSLRHMRPYRTPFLDNRFVDLSLLMPVKYRLRRNVVDEALSRLDERLASIPHAGTGVPPKQSFPVSYLRATGTALWRKHVASEQPPRPHLSNGPWMDDRELIRHHDFVELAFEENRDVIDALPFFDWDDVQRCYREHVDGEDNLVEIYSLLSVLAMPITGKIAFKTEVEREERAEERDERAEERENRTGERGEQAHGEKGSVATIVTDGEGTRHGRRRNDR